MAQRVAGRSERVKKRGRRASSPRGDHQVGLAAQRRAAPRRRRRWRGRRRRARRAASAASKRWVSTVSVPARLQRRSPPSSASAGRARRRAAPAISPSSAASVKSQPLRPTSSRKREHQRRGVAFTAARVELAGGIGLDRGLAAGAPVAVEPAAIVAGRGERGLQQALLRGASGRGVEALEDRRRRQRAAGEGHQKRDKHNKTENQKPAASPNPLTRTEASMRPGRRPTKRCIFLNAARPPGDGQSRKSPAVRLGVAGKARAEVRPAVAVEIGARRCRRRISDRGRVSRRDGGVAGRSGGVARAVGVDAAEVDRGRGPAPRSPRPASERCRGRRWRGRPRTRRCRRPRRRGEPVAARSAGRRRSRRRCRRRAGRCRGRRPAIGAAPPGAVGAAAAATRSAKAVPAHPVGADGCRRSRAVSGSAASPNQTW